MMKLITIILCLCLGGLLYLLIPNDPVLEDGCSDSKIDCLKKVPKEATEKTPLEQDDSSVDENGSGFKTRHLLQLSNNKNDLLQQLTSPKLADKSKDGIKVNSAFIICRDSKSICRKLSSVPLVQQLPRGIRNATVAEGPTNPLKFVLPPAEESGDHFEPTRFKRFPRKCNDTLRPMKNAIITCSAWPNFLTCDINCTYGYALREDGKSQWTATRTCRESDNYWLPKANFPLCEPYINCQTVLIKPGDMSCKTSLLTPSYCDIMCFADYENEEIDVQRYECVDEAYPKILPHCAAVVQNITLIGLPEKEMNVTQTPF